MLKIKSYNTVACIVFLFTLPGQTQDSTSSVPADSALAEAILIFKTAEKTWELERFHKADRAFNKVLLQAEKSGHQNILYWIGAANFHLVNLYLWGTEDLKNGKKGKYHINQALKSLEKGMEIKPESPEILALTGTLYGIKIYKKPYMAPILGPRVNKLVRKGLAIEPENPRINYLIGVSYLFTPGFLGGGAEKGLKYLLLAESYFQAEAEKLSGPLDAEWGRSACLGFIAKAYEKMKKYELAKSYFHKALTVNPNDKMAEFGLKELEEELKD